MKRIPGLPTDNGMEHFDGGNSLMRTNLCRRGSTTTVMAMAVFFLGLGSPSIATAGPPARSHYTLQFPGVIDCGTFQDIFTDYFDIAETDQFDRYGNLVKIVLHAEHTSDDMNSVTGLTLHERGHYVETVDLLADTDTVTGNVAIINVPGSGAVVQITGRLVYSPSLNIDDLRENLVFFAGPRKHSEVLLGDQVLCDALK